MNGIALAVFVAWVALGLGLGWVMGRRGYEAYTWALVGVVLGPLGVALAVAWLIRPPAHEPTLLRQGAGKREGTLDVLVAFDGSPEAHAALSAVQRLLGDRIGRLTLARVVLIDAPHDVVRHAEAGLDEACALVTTPASTVLLRGQPAGELKAYAHRLGYDVLALGTRGEGRSHALLGSVASALVRGAGLPVVLADAHAGASVAA
jgi:nucleotide-binding universal stress UspA family protein